MAAPTQEIPPWLREQLTRFDQLQQNLQAIFMQKQQVDLELSEIDKAERELTKLGAEDEVYKMAGSLLMKVGKDEMLKELVERKEIAKTRAMVLAKQEVRVRENAKELQMKIDEAIRGRTPASEA